MSACAAPLESVGFIGSVTRFIDCQVELVGTGAYQALGMPGSTLSIVLTGFLTIFIALIGYRLLLGDHLTLRDGTIAFVKIGLVFALATSWPAWRTLVYDLMTDGPSQIVSEIARPAAVPGSDGSLVRRLDMADGALVQLAIAGVGLPQTEEQRASVAPPPFAGFNAFALGGSRILFLLTAVAGLAAIRIVAALMLALGPFFIAFLLFDSTRSLFEGWVRVLAGAAIGAIGAAVALGLELALIEPWLSGILARRAAGEALPSVPTELIVVTALFAIIVVAVIIACARLATAFRLAPVLRWTGTAGTALPLERPLTATADAQLAERAARGGERSRAAVLADGVVSLDHRRGAAQDLAGNRRMVVAGAPAPEAAIGEMVRRPVPVPVGRSFRRARPRVSALANRRDRN